MGCWLRFIVAEIVVRTARRDVAEESYRKKIFYGGLMQRDGLP
jgi:hypothetical protein